MASILRVNTLTDASSGNSTDMSTINQGTAKAWVNFNGTGTIAARDSFNVGSLTDNGTGDYSCNFSNGMNNTNYISTFGFDGFGVGEMSCIESSTSRRNTTALVGALTNDNTGNAIDINFVYTSIHGDLA